VHLKPLVRCRSLLLLFEVLLTFAGTSLQNEIKTNDAMRYLRSKVAYISCVISKSSMKSDNIQYCNENKFGGKENSSINTKYQSWSQPDSLLALLWSQLLGFLYRFFKHLLNDEAFPWISQ
jgi:hypothetical protein